MCVGCCRRDRDAALVHWPPPLVIPEELEDAEMEVPDVFKCPITLGIMTEPAQTPQGESTSKCSCAISFAAAVPFLGSPELLCNGPVMKLVDVQAADCSAHVQV